jgi:hypothetical protein
LALQERPRWQVKEAGRGNREQSFNSNPRKPVGVPGDPFRPRL